VTEPDYRFSADLDEMDRNLTHRWLSEQSYWAKGRPRDVHERAMDASRNFGMFDTATGAQVAFARVITDGATFAWLADVFVDESVRGRGVGIALMEGIMATLEPLRMKRMGLVTSDAHGLYAKFGFTPLADAGTHMERMLSPMR
jgi:GNAT superfamily N-acetyltransferase